MGLFSKVAKSGIAVKLVNEARKPHNQRKAKDLISQLRNRGGGTGGSTGRPQPRP